MKQTLLRVFLLLSLFNNSYPMDTNTDPSIATLKCLEGIMNNLPWLVQASIAQGADVTYTKLENPFRCHNLLQIACRLGHQEIVACLLQVPGIDVDAYDKKRRTGSPLWIAFHEKHPGIVTSILNHTPGAINALDVDCRSLLHNACSNGNEEMIRLLLSNENIDVNIRNFNQCTPLHFAVEAQNKNILALILAHPKRDINTKNILGYTALLQSCSYNNEEITQLLLAEKDINVLTMHDSKGNSSLHWAVCKQRKYLSLFLNHVKKNALISQQNYFGDTPLHIACETGNHKGTQLLVKKGANTTIRNHQGRTPLAIAYTKGHFEHFDGHTGKPTIMSKMIQDKDADGNTQLHLATTTITPIKPHLLNMYLSMLTSNVTDNVVSVSAKNNHGKLAVDLAYDEYHETFQHYCKKRNDFDKQKLTKQEQTLHSFLRITAPHMDMECALFTNVLKFQTYETSLPPEIKQLITHNYYQLNVEKIMAKKYKDDQKYYDNFVENKNKIKKQLHKNSENLQLLWK